MGYLTDYTLTSSDNNKTKNSDEFYEKFDELTGYNSDDLYGIKWYDSDEDMTKLSLSYPDIYFTLKGVGEDQDKPWVIYYKNGKSYEAKVIIAIEEFDESKLK